MALKMIVGVREDPQFGPFILAGFGGVTAEVIRDVAIRMLPIDEDIAREMIASLRGAPLLGNFRGRPSRDVAALVRSIVGLSQLFIDHRPWISELEINPLTILAEGDGVRGVDVRLVPRS